MNKNTLYFRLIDIVSISYCVLIILCFLDLPVWANFLEISFMLLGFSALITIDFARYDEFALQCRDHAFALTGRTTLIFGPLVMVVFIPVGAGFVDGFTGAEPGSAYGRFTFLEPFEIGLAIWVIAFSIYLGSFQWVRFRGKPQ